MGSEGILLLLSDPWAGLLLNRVLWYFLEPFWRWLFFESLFRGCSGSSTFSLVELLLLRFFFMGLSAYWIQATGSDFNNYSCFSYGYGGVLLFFCLFFRELGDIEDCFFFDYGFSLEILVAL